MWQDHLSHRAAAVPDISSTSPRLWANNSPLAKEVKKKPNYWMWEYATRFVIQVVKSQHTAFNEQVWTLTDFEPTSSTEVANDWSWCRLGQKEGSERVVLSISRKYSSDSIILILNSSGGVFLFCFFQDSVDPKAKQTKRSGFSTFSACNSKQICSSQLYSQLKS